LAVALYENPDFHIWVATHLEWQRNIFGDAERALAAALRKLGYVVNVTYGPLPPTTDAQVIVLGYNVLQELRLMPPNAIIYQLEQMGSTFAHHHLEMLRRNTVWDFSSYNIEGLRKRGCSKMHLCRFGGGLPVTVPSARKDIDVLFVGSRVQRRKVILDRLRARGLNVHDEPAWGAQRDALIDRSKILLNMHLFDEAVLEMVRLSAVMLRQPFIVSEIGRDPDLERLLSGGIVLSKYNDLVETVMAQLARTQDERDGIARQGTAAFEAFSYADEVRRCLSASLPHMKPKRVKCYINNRNRLAWTRDIVREIERLGGEPIIVDNASTYPPLLAWYASGCPWRIVRLGDNVGSRAPWISGTIDREVRRGELYVVTDPDLDLAGVPDDALSVLARGLDKHGARKAGLSLEINDVPRELLGVRQLNNLTLEQIESHYWANRLDAEFWKAAVDTTFAMYRHNGRVAMDVSFYDGVRADRPYTAKHLPWYRAEKDFDEEDRYYVAHRKVTNVNGTWYDSVRANAPGGP